MCPAIYTRCLPIEAPAGARKEEVVAFSVVVTETKAFLGPPAVVVALTRQARAVVVRAVLHSGYSHVVPDTFCWDCYVTTRAERIAEAAYLKPSSKSRM